MLELFAQIADGESWEEVGFPGDPTKVAADRPVV